MRIDISHFVLESPCNTDDQIVDYCFDCPKGCDILASTVVKFYVDGVTVRSGEADGKMRKVLGEFA